MCARRHSRLLSLLLTTSEKSTKTKGTSFWSPFKGSKASKSDSSSDSSSPSSDDSHGTASRSDRMREAVVNLKRSALKQVSDKHVTPFWTSYRLVSIAKPKIPIHYNLMLTSGEIKAFTSDLRPAAATPADNAQQPASRIDQWRYFYADENPARTGLGLEFVFDMQSQLVEGMRLPKDVTHQPHTMYENRMKITAFRHSRISSSVELSVKRYQLCEATQFQPGGDGEEFLANREHF